MQRSNHPWRWLSTAAALFASLPVLLAPLPALAATISSVSITLNPGNSADFFDNAGAEASAVQSTAVVSSSSASAFATRYAAVVSADRGGSGGPGTTTQNFTGDFSITFNVTETAGVLWEIGFDVWRIGAQTIVSDGTGNASVSLSALTGTESGAGSIISGSLGLAALPTLANVGTPGTPTVDTPFNQTGYAILAALGTGFAQAVTLNFSFTASAVSIDPPGGSVQGDEAALRMGLNSALSSFTADDYGGIGSRLIAGDGIFISAGFVTAPEPGTALLLGFGLVALGLHRRRAR